MTAATRFAVLGAAVVAAQFAAPSGVPRGIACLLIVAAATSAVFAGLLRFRPERPAAWWVLCAGMLLAVSAHAVHLTGLLLADPRLANGVNRGVELLAMLVVAAAAVVFVAARRPGQDLEGLLDGLMLVSGVALLALTAPGWLPQPDRFVAVMIATVAGAILVMVLRLLVGSRRLPTSMLALLVAVALKATGSLLVALHGLEPFPPRYTDAFFLLAAVLVGASALHPSMVQVTRPDPAPERRVTPVRLVALGAALLVNPIVALRANLTHRVPSPLLATGVVVLTVLVLWRIGRLLRQRERFQAALLRSEVRLQALVQHAFDAIMVLDGGGTIRYASPALGRMLGRPEGSFTGVDAHDLVAAADLSALRTALTGIRCSTDPARLEVRLRRADGAIMWGDLSLVNRLEDPAVEGIVVNLRDSTSRKRTETELQRLALHDPLTGLPNRAALMDSLQAALHYDTPRFEGLAVLFVDMDGFKTVNDEHGHGVGDRLLVGVADRLRTAVRPYDTVSRYGGDEFVVVATGIQTDPQAVVLAERLRAHLRPAFTWSGADLHVDCTIGVARIDRCGIPGEQLIAAADRAMYRARQNGEAMAVQCLTCSGQHSAQPEIVPAPTLPDSPRGPG